MIIRNTERLRLQKKRTAQQNEGLTPYNNDTYVCMTCGNVGLSHPETSCCFLCGVDNWEKYDAVKIRHTVHKTIIITR